MRHNYSDTLPTADAVRGVYCPKCGAVEGERCVEPDGKTRKQDRNHQQRQDAWKASRPRRSLK